MQYNSEPIWCHAVIVNPNVEDERRRLFEGYQHVFSIALTEEDRQEHLAKRFSEYMSYTLTTPVQPLAFWRSDSACVPHL